MFGSRNRPGVDQLTAAGLKGRLDHGEPIAVLDVREPDERAFCAIPLPTTARDLHVPMNDVPGRLDEIREAAGAGPLVVYCHHGVRSMNVAAWLARQGLPGLANLSGGIDAWSTDVDPSVRRY